MKKIIAVLFALLIAAPAQADWLYIYWPKHNEVYDCAYLKVYIEEDIYSNIFGRSCNLVATDDTVWDFVVTAGFVVVDVHAPQRKLPIFGACKKVATVSMTGIDSYTVVDCREYRVNP